MRSELLAYLKTQNFGTVKVASEFPFSTKAGTEPLYVKNTKSIYVDQDQTTQEPLFNTMDGGSIVAQTTKVIAYLTLDAKAPLVNYDSIVSKLTAARNLLAIDGNLDRTVSVAKSYDGDIMLTEFTFEFKEILTTQ
jgi:hypothetical protein